MLEVCSENKFYLYSKHILIAMNINSLLPIIFLIFTTSCTVPRQSANQMPAIQSSMIWSTSEIDKDGGYVVFRKSFELSDANSPAQLQLFADSRYLLWINGQYVLRGPCRFNPKRPEYDVVDIRPHLKKGTNVMVAMVHHYGNVINGRIMKHAPGLAMVLELQGREILRTDSSWRFNDKTMYLRSPGSWNTIPDVIDARIDNAEWISTGFDDSEWPFAMAVDGNQWGTMFPCELPLQKENDLQNLTFLPSGEPLSAKLPVELTAGQEVLVDFGTMAMAYTSMDLDADLGSELTMRYALRYKNGKAEEMYGKGNKYTARAGRQSFMTTDQWGSRYMLVKCDTGRVVINGIKITDRRYPFDRIGKFTSNDDLLNKFWDMAVKTIEVTTDDGYGSDARERNEWIQDASKPSYLTSRVATAGPGKDGKPVYSDPRPLKNMLRHAAQSQLPDGRLLATFPTDRGPEDCHYVIEDYSCQWFEALKMYYDATGDKEFVREMWPTAVAQLKWFLDRRTPRGLLMAREYASFDNPLAYITCEGATINAYFYDALRVSVELAQLIGENQQASLYRQAAEDLKTAYNRELWNENERAYNSAFFNDKLYAPTVHAQLIALHYGLVPEDRETYVRNWFLANYKNPGMKHVCTNPDYKKMVDMKAGINTPVMYFWVFSELYRMDTEEQDREVIGEIRRRWTPMVLFQQDAGTLSESFTDEKGEGANESCHNYGSTPAWFLSSYILGVRRIGTVNDKQLLIEPRLGDLTFAEGVVVTEHGAVPVSWKKSDDGKILAFKFSIPEGVRAEIRFPGMAERIKINLNGKVLSENEVKTRGRWMIVQNVTGEGSGTINME
jgi:alpha-L-rhamnosidase